MNSHVPVDQLNATLKKVGDHQLKEEKSPPQEHVSTASEEIWIQTYFPWILIAAYLVSGVLLRELSMSRFNLYTMMANFMGGFFVIERFQSEALRRYAEECRGCAASCRAMIGNDF